MRSFSFALFLSACLSNSTPADASPFQARGQLQSNSGMVTMPLKCHHVPPDVDLHPQVLLQQYINHGSRRLARMTGREEPSEYFLRSELHKRLYLVMSGPGSRTGAAGVAQGSNFSRRYYNTDRAVAVIRSGTICTGSITVARGATACNGTDTGVSPLGIEAATHGSDTVVKQHTASDLPALAIEASDVGYLTTVQIGSPPQDFLLLIDSSSADFWVVGETCQLRSGAGCGNRTTLGPSSSTSFTSFVSLSFPIKYQSMMFEGQVCQDNVNIGGVELRNHIFGVSLELPFLFASNNTPFDGIMGFALSALSEERVPTLVESLAANKLIQAPITSFKIPRLADQLNDGEITFGGLDATKFVADTLVTIVNINTMGYWEGDMDAITVNGTGTTLTGRTAIFDTSATFIIAPLSDAQYVMESLGGTCDTQQCTISCTTRASLALSFGNRPFAIDPRDLAFRPIDPSNPSGTCMAAIQPQNVGSLTAWLVGGVFLMNTYFSINLQTNNISFASLTTPSFPSPISRSK